MSTQLSNNIIYDANGRLVAQPLVTVDDAVNPSFSTLQVTGLTASRALVSDSTMHVISSTCTSTELGYVSGVTSAIQTQLNARLPLTGGTLSGDLTIYHTGVDSIIHIGAVVGAAQIIGDTSGDLKFEMDKANSVISFLPSNSGNASWFQANGSWSFGDTTLTASAAVGIYSTTKGFLPPVMTTTQRDAITSPAEGLQIWNSTTHVPNFYDGTSWKAPVIA